MATTEVGRQLITLDPVWGLPPETFVSNNMIKNTMPVATIIPSVPSFVIGLSLYTTSPAWTEYNSLLNYHGYRLSKNSIKVAFLAENFPTDNFQNEYGESFINKISDIASQGAGEIAQVFGARTALGGVRKFGETLGKVSGALAETPAAGIGTFLGKIGATVGTGAAGVEEALTKARNTGGLGAGARGALSLINRLLAGQRVDFPQVWKNSGFTPSYQLTIRLYNPKPGDKTSTSKYIVGPIVALMLLAVPQTSDGQTYSWPFLQNIDCPGIFNVSPSFIGNIAVVKGGDQQSIAYNQRLGIVDVRLDIGSLYNSMVAGRVKLAEKQRPTLKNYAEAMLKVGDTGKVYGDPVGYKVDSPRQLAVTQQQAPTRLDISTTPTSRVSQQQKDTFDEIYDRVLALGF